MKLSKEAVEDDIMSCLHCVKHIPSVRLSKDTWTRPMCTSQVKRDFNTVLMSCQDFRKRYIRPVYIPIEFIEEQEMVI